MNLKQMSDQELQALVDQVRRELAERKLRHQNRTPVLGSQLLDGVRWTKEMILCGNPKCKRCRQRKEGHGPYYKPFTYNPSTGKMKAGKPQREAPEGWR